MAVIHHTTLRPTKLELLASWLPSRPWYLGGTDEPDLAKAGGFRLDDPQGAVGIEFMVVTDASGARPTAYLVPLTYRGAPLDGAEHALVGTMEHGVLGRRWAYDGCHDPVLVTQLLALIEGRVQAQAQSISDTPDLEVTRSYTGDGLATTDIRPTPTDDREATELPISQGAILHLHRVLRPAPDDAPLPEGAAGHVAGPWRMPDGTREQGLFATVRV
ncbi:maltokinase N-terminal cap-like domain-containing protein [Actinoallomurus rhizosphaericola]|uniref:maltokinase N-terminal cap-like domain-containing protein n=1 Tax=Actinoallomurus rhizosphaericola TaxID=2952536 RepID=UPI002093319B|nr:1,4-alpha-glucan branching protein [Actinoallomurus rhizosphaericola]MCO5994834.1 1,4-alpha-glucan branching protein [Actinoallomurus rhizosphaericola]